MVKSIIKEILIIILLIVAITLVLGILFYDYRPTNKKVPSEVSAYILPTEVQTELDETIKTAESQNIIKTYRVEGRDLDYYKRTNEYDTGKVNPFGRISEGVSNNTNSNGNENTSGNGTNGGGYFNTVK